MSNRQDQTTEKAKPRGNVHPDEPASPDVKQEDWSAEQIAEQAVHKDATETKQELKQGQKTQRKEGRSS